jgi:hypothetical protein
MAWRKNDPNLTNDPTYLEPRLSQVEADIVNHSNEIGILKNIIVSIEEFPRLSGETDDTGRIQRAINAVYNNGNGAGYVHFPAGLYIASSIVLKRKVKLIGSGHFTILKLADNTNSHFITLDQTSPVGGCGLINLSVDGNKANNTTGDAIYLSTTQGDFQDQGTWYGDEKIIIDGVRVYNSAGNGITIASGLTQTMLQNVFVQYSGGYGVYNTVTDCWFFNVFVHHSQKSGFFVNQSNNYYVNCKAWMNGQLDRNLYSGWEVKGRSNVFTNCEAQENFGHGWLLKDCVDIQLHGCTADANGILDFPPTSTSDQTKNGFELQNAVNITLNVNATDFRKRLYGVQNTNIGVHLDANCWGVHTNLQASYVAVKYQDDSTGGGNIYMNSENMYGGVFSAKSVASTGRITSNNGEFFANGTSGELGLTVQNNGTKRMFIGQKTANSLFEWDVYDSSGNYIGTPISVDYSGRLRVGESNHSMGFFGANPILKPTVTGSRGGNAALTSLLQQLAALGLITDNTTA